MTSTYLIHSRDIKDFLKEHPDQLIEVVASLMDVLDLKLIVSTGYGSIDIKVEKLYQE